MSPAKFIRWSEVALANDALHSVAIASIENQNFMLIDLGGQKYRTLFNLGATISVADRKSAQ